MLVYYGAQDTGPGSPIQMLADRLESTMNGPDVRVLDTLNFLDFVVGVNYSPFGRTKHSQMQAIRLHHHTELSGVKRVCCKAAANIWLDLGGKSHDEGRDLRRSTLRWNCLKNEISGLN
jgi:hypothetical protein